MNKEVPHYFNHMVCEAPGGDGFHIDYMPEFFNNDKMDNSKPHVHTFYEIIWFQEEGGTHTVDFREYDVKKNSLFFLSPGQVHCFDGKTQHKGLLLKFCTDFMNEAHDGGLFIKYDVFNSFDAEPFCVVPDETAEILAELVQKMETEKKLTSSFAHMEMLRSLVRMFLIQVQRNCNKSDSFTVTDKNASYRLFKNFRKTLEQQYRTLHTVGEYAACLNVSSKTLSNSVSACSGQTPLAFINDRIVLEAKRLLKFTDMMVKEIAYYLGFDDPSYFVKLFKRKTGYLPSEFREEYQLG